MSVARQLARANHLALDVFEVALGDVNGVAQLDLSEQSDSSNPLVPGFKRSDEAIEVSTIGSTITLPARGRARREGPVEPPLGRAFDRYRERLRTCEARFNSRVPFTRTFVAAMKRGGPSEVVASGHRHLVGRRGENATVPPEADA